MSPQAILLSAMTNLELCFWCLRRRGWWTRIEFLTRAQKFYETVLDIKMEQMDSHASDTRMVAFPMKMDLPNIIGALVKTEGLKSGGSSTIVYFDTQDCSKEEARVVTAGGEVFKKKIAIDNHGFVSVCKDSEGNMFGLHSLK